MTDVAAEWDLDPFRYERLMGMDIPGEDSSPILDIAQAFCAYFQSGYSYAELQEKINMHADEPIPFVNDDEAALSTPRAEPPAIPTMADVEPPVYGLHRPVDTPPISDDPLGEPSTEDAEKTRAISAAFLKASDAMTSLATSLGDLTRVAGTAAQSLTVLNEAIRLARRAIKDADPRQPLDWS